MKRTPAQMSAGWSSPSADLQVAFFHRLSAVRNQYLADSLEHAIGLLPDLTAVDTDLNHFVDKSILLRLAQFGLRGEVLFATPTLLKASPLLLGYYRLLYGISQKEFYHKGPYGRFKPMEENGALSTANASLLEVLCRSLAVTGRQLLDGIDRLSLQVVHELQLLTLGPQFRGSENTRIGDRAIASVREIIRGIVGKHIQSETRKTLLIENAAQRSVLIEFASDPDVLMTEQLGEEVRYILSVEVKGGRDASNILNRLGEAEKSHLKAKSLGCNDLWTITQVDRQLDAAQRASPTTTQFFNLESLLKPRSAEFNRFADGLRLRLGLPRK